MSDSRLGRYTHSCTMLISRRKGVHTFVRKSSKAKVMNFIRVNISVSVTRVPLLGFPFQIYPL